MDEFILDQIIATGIGFFMPNPALRPPPGHGYLAGTFPDGITKVEGIPTSLEVRVLYRPESGAVGDGVLVKSTISNPDGTWLIEGLDHTLKFDVVCRGEGYNDQIWSNVSPALATGLRFVGRFGLLTDQVEIQFGTGPYQVDVVGGTPPPGVTFVAEGDFVVATGIPTAVGEFIYTLRVVGANGLSGTFESTTEVAGDPHWDKVVSLLQFDNGIVDEKGKIWSTPSPGKVDTINPLSGSGSWVLNSYSSNQLSTPDHIDFDFGDDDFTIELLYKPVNLRRMEWPGLLSKRSSNANVSWSVWTSAGSSVAFTVATTNGVRHEFAAPVPLIEGQTYHLAFTRVAEDLNIFVDGVKSASRNIGPLPLRNNTNPVAVGALNGLTEYMALGVYDEIRITKGVSRYTENFTPPTEPFPNRGPA